MQILWENCLQNDIGNTCLASVDGADFQIKGKKLLDGSPNKWYYSYKFKAPGLLYLVALSICTSDIVFVAGPYLPGIYNDLSIFRQCGIMDKMEQYEKVEADDGYMGECPRFRICPGWHSANEEQSVLHGRV